MFGFEQWDSPIALGLEALLSIAIVVGVLRVARRVNAQAAAERARALQMRESPTSTGTDMNHEGHEGHEEHEGC